MAIHYHSHEEYTNRVLMHTTFQYAVRAEDRWQDTGVGLRIHVWDDVQQAVRLIDLKTGNPSVIRPTVRNDAPEEICKKADLWNAVEQWMSQCVIISKQAMTPDVGKRATISPRCRKVPHGLGVVTINFVGTGQYGRYAHVITPEHMRYQFIDFSFLEVVADERYNAPPCPWDANDDLTAILTNARLMVKDSVGFWWVVADLMEDVGHPTAWAIRSVANSWDRKRQGL